MSMFGLGRPQPSSAEKIAAAEQEMDMVTDMFNKYALPPSFRHHSETSLDLLHRIITRSNAWGTGYNKHAYASASLQHIEKARSTREKACVSIDAPPNSSTFR